MALESRYGPRGFDYVGNEIKDIHVWDRARRAIVASPTLALRRRLGKIRNLERVFDRPSKKLSRWIDAIRVHQWAKNLLIFMPAVTAQRMLELPILLTTATAAGWFCLCASGAYIVNDLLDLDADRKHPRKRHRPFAAGEISLQHGLVAAACLIVGSSRRDSDAGPSVRRSARRLSCRRALVFDRAETHRHDGRSGLAGLYSVRVLAGAVAIGVFPSFWLLAFSMFMFLNLAIVKRYVELRSVLLAGESTAAGRGYNTDDLSLLLSCGTSAGFTSVLVFALYINSGISALYRHPQILLAPLSAASLLDPTRLAQCAPRRPPRRSGRVCADRQAELVGRPGVSSVAWERALTVWGTQGRT